MRPQSEFARHGTGIALYLTGVFFFAANDALGKWLVADYSVAEILLVRSIGAVAMLLPVAYFARTGFSLKSRWRLHLIRILLQTGDSYCFYFASRHLPLADVMTFYMGGPIILTAVSGLFLGEKVGVYRLGAVLVGFVGVVIALQPSGASISIGSLVALAGSVQFALSLAMTRKLRDTHPMPLVIWQFIGSGLIGAALCPFAWTTPGPVDGVLMLTVGVVAAFCFLCITRALALAPASLLAPFQYSSILWAALFGWMVWHDVPTPHIVIGNAILIASGLFVFYRERVRAVAREGTVQPIP
jgi:S-adenosylmethionine uptake transporter